MMKFKIGDLVKIKKDCDMPYGWNANMDIYDGKICIITIAKGDYYEIKPFNWYADCTQWSWSKSVFTKLTPEQAMLELL